MRWGLFMNGTCGSGKTTIGAAVVELAARSGESVAFVDMDALSQSWPRPQDDPFNKVLGIRNLGSVVRNFSDAGVMSVVIAGVIRDEEDLARYEEALRLNLTVVRLLAPLDVIDEAPKPTWRRRCGRHGLAPTACSRTERDPGPLCGADGCRIEHEAGVGSRSGGLDDVWPAPP